ncbi:MAG: AAA family ATPase [Desulfovibrionaceae bacterium]|nr:AAA family ATPase [Desulfovibrionaceae bacterium]
MFAREDYIKYMISQGMKSASSYASGLKTIEATYSVDIDNEYRNDHCSSLLTKLNSDKINPNLSALERKYRSDYVSYLKKYIEFKQQYTNPNSQMNNLYGLFIQNNVKSNKEGQSTMTDIRKNTILYGPPGTGKTYHTVMYAVAIIENKPLEEVKAQPYDDVIKRYRQYLNDGQICFTTFHQSYGYEDFIEGIKPVTDDNGNICYDREDGLFKKFCDKASLSYFSQDLLSWGFNENSTVWKVSLYSAGDNPIRTDCLNNGHIRIGWDSYGADITDETNFENGGKAILDAFINRMEIGDIVFSCYSNKIIDAIGVITGEYEWCAEYSEYCRKRNVKWLVKGIKEDIYKINGKQLMRPGTVYKMKIALRDVLSLIAKYSSSVSAKRHLPKYVFIIDEINRGNISKIFGELITLIEESKRIGKPEEIKTSLRYDTTPFGVPDNVYILGTMNTADCSIAMLDTALRRRFHFKEIMPKEKLLEGITISGIAVNEILKTMNERIAVLYDRDHQIGHAYFMKLKDNATLTALGQIFKNEIIPLLQEYFHDDYQKIRLVLGDNQKQGDQDHQFITCKEQLKKELFGNSDDDLPIEDNLILYEMNHDAFDKIESYNFLVPKQ